ncbi:N-acetylmuramoyl-L-alanine amidase family protein [Lutimonas sp.]|uniref:N-acetylmuramoyl-L-alanine amidase family protein n=1 Tax=Lutimonas sp. TaxID=1872403 RepID=UPI003D9BCF5B
MVGLGKKRVNISIITGLFCFMAFTFAGINCYAQESFVVVLDAGHGGKDPGKATKNIHEKDIALSVVLKLGKKLEALKDVEVVYTRKTDIFLDLKERGRIANEADADLFLSIHCNAFHTQAYGTETYVLGLHANKQNFEVAKLENSVIFMEDNYEEKYEGFDPNSPEAVIGMTLMQEEFLDQSLSLASDIQTNFRVDIKRKDRGVKQAGFVVLHQTYMPSVLIETGFITNTEEGMFLNSNNGQDKVSNAIFSAIKAYKKNIDENLVVEEVAVIEEKPGKLYPGVDFKVQIASGKKKLETKSYNFKGLKGVERGKIGGVFKYYYGKTSDYDEIVSLQSEARKAGFKTAFVVAFKDGDRVNISDVIH